MSELLKIDFSGSNTFYTCPRKYLLQNIQGWSKETGSTALRFGGAFHAGMEGYYSYVRDHGWSRDGKAVEQMLRFAAKEYAERTKDKLFYDDYRTLENLVLLLSEYISHFYADHGFLEVTSTERAFKILMKPTKKDLTFYPDFKPFYFTGKIDLECKLNGMHWTNEFKTTGWRIDQVIEELNRSPQVMGYAFAKNVAYDEPPEGCLVTVAHCTSRKLKAGGYGKLSTNFRRSPQIYNEYDLTEWRSYFISLVTQIQQARKINNFPPRYQNCYKYGRCEYLNLCEQSQELSACSYRGYVQETPWDVLTEVSQNPVKEAEENHASIS